MTSKQTQAASNDPAAYNTVYTPVSAPPPPSQAKALKSATDVFNDMADLRGADVEHFVMYTLNARHVIIKRHIVAVGQLAGVEIHPRTIFRRLLEDNAFAWICAHNHPSGDPAPSGEDCNLTRRFQKCSELFGIMLLDHVIVVANGYVSLSERGWFM